MPVHTAPCLRPAYLSYALAVPVDATLRLCLQCFSLATRYIAILSLLHVLLYLTQQVYSLAFQCHALTGYAFPWRRLSARVIACAGQSLVKNWPTQPSALRGRPVAQGAG